MAMQNLIIRQMQPEDVDTALLIERQSFTTPWSATSFLSEVRSPASTALMAELNGTCVGYIIVKIVADECHLYDLAVDPKLRRRGIAKALLQNILKILDHTTVRFFFLEVRASNDPAINLYRAMGFSEYALRRSYYEKPTEDAILMRLSLTEKMPAFE
jgi:ribosomal-protein-alanine N-acetyltransferase